MLNSPLAEAVAPEESKSYIHAARRASSSSRRARLIAPMN